MPEEEYDSYTGTAGLMDDVDITVTDAMFKFDSEYNDGKTLLCVLTVTNEEDNEESEIMLSTGSGWEDAKGSKGKAAVLESTGEPNKKGFNRSCRYYKFAMAADKAGAPLRERGQLYDADIWTGLRFHVELKTETNPVTHEERDNLYPTKYLGEKGKKASGAKKSAKKDAEEEPEEKADTDGEVPVAMKAKLKALAKKCDSHDDFIERAMSEVDGVTENEAAEALVIDEEFYNEVTA